MTRAQADLLNLQDYIGKEFIIIRSLSQWPDIGAPVKLEKVEGEWATFKALTSSKEARIHTSELSTYVDLPIAHFVMSDKVEIKGIAPECRCSFKGLGHDLDCEYVKSRTKAI